MRKSLQYKKFSVEKFAVQKVVTKKFILKSFICEPGPAVQEKNLRFRFVIYGEDKAPVFLYVQS